MELTTHAAPLLLLATGALLALPAPLLVEHRQRAAATLLAIMLAGLFISFIVVPETPFTSLILAMLASLLMAAPLLERARFTGLAIAAVAGGCGTLAALETFGPRILPPLAPLAMLPVALSASLLVGMIGGMKLPLHPKRHAATGAAIWRGAPQGVMLAGWALFTLALAAMAYTLNPEALGLPQLASTLVAAFVALFYAEAGNGEDSLQKAGEGLAAGLLIALLAPVTPMAGAALGLVAGFFVTRSEAISHSLRIDDAQHLNGALLLPALAGLILPGIADSHLLAPQLQWLGGVVALGLLVSVILWPVAMFLFGIALPPKLVREGVRP